MFIRILDEHMKEKKNDVEGLTFNWKTWAAIDNKLIADLWKRYIMLNVGGKKGKKKDIL